MNLVSDLNLLAALQALLEERNVTNAGNRIGLGQPAMSGVLARLRRHFSNELLLRVGRHYELTPLAEQLLPVVREAVALADKALRMSKEFDAESSDRTFRIAACDWSLVTIVEPLLRGVWQQSRTVRVEIDSLPTGIDADGLRLLALRRDLVLLPLGHTLSGRGQRIAVDELLLVGDLHNEQLAGTCVSVEALSALPHITCFDDQVTSPGYRRLAELGVEWKIEARVASLSMIPMLVVGTDLIGLVPRRVLQSIDDGKMQVAARRLPFDAAIHVLMHWNPERDDDPGHRWLRTVVRHATTNFRLPANVDALTSPLVGQPGGTEPPGATPAEVVYKIASA